MEIKSSSALVKWRKNWRVGRGEGFTWEDLSMEEIIRREENFDEGGAGFSSIFKKKTMRKQFFYTGSNEQH